MNNNILVSVQGVGKTYDLDGANQTALASIDIQINQGEYVAIVGNSGSGKSTLLNILGCLDLPTTGEYFLDGFNIRTLKDDEISAIRGTTIGFVFQSFHLLKSLKIIDNVALPAIYAGASRSQAKAMAMQKLKEFNMEQFSSRYPNQLSGGQQQRCAIARALVNKPKILLADEPTGNLDSENTASVISLLKRLNKTNGLTVIVVTHEATVSSTADRIIRVHDGSVSYDGPAILDKP
jgi:putative ABC transport system ATP-binding protein